MSSPGYPRNRLWWRDAPEPAEVLRDAAAKIYRWAGGPMSELESRKFAVA